MAGVANWRLTVWDSRNGQEKTSAALEAGLFTCLAFSPDSKFIAIGGEQGNEGIGIMRCYDLHEKRCYVVFEKDVGRVFAVGWAGKGTILAVGNHGPVVKRIRVHLQGE